MSEAGSIMNYPVLSDFNAQYSELVSEVYLGPIRSVVVVDDEFPTLDALIEGALDKTNAWAGNPRDAEAVKDILSFCRGRSRPWLVDVHDGREIDVAGEINIAKHLHHSDLMILDYHLLGDDGSGEKSIRILRHLAANPHFNLVIVYTKGYSGDIQRVFLEIATALTFNETCLISSEVFKKVNDQIAEWEDTEDGISERLLSMISHADYILERSKPGTFLASPGRAGIQEILRSSESGKKLSLREVISWIFENIHRRFNSAMSKVDFGNTCSSFQNHVNWIKTDSLFVTVVDKSIKAHELEGKLAEALASFSPPPHQLIMARMRSLIDERGVIAEAGVLNNKYMQAGWLSEIFNDHVGNRTTVIKNTVDRHWEALGDQLRTDVEEFAVRLVENIQQQGREIVLKRYCNDVYNESETILAHINLYNSTKPVDFSHLRPGHIFVLDTIDSPVTQEFWICLSPACDLIPGQKNGGWRGKLGERIPFIAVQLNRIGLTTALDKIQDNINLFISINGEIRSFSYCPDANPMASPLWEQMFALNNGKFVNGNGNIPISRLGDVQGEIISKTYEVQVIAQLRNEYAANLLQRLGINLSRVGLNFRSRSLKNS